VSIHGELEQCSKHVEKYEDGKTSGWRVKSKVHWRDYGDSCKKNILGQQRPATQKQRLQG
jgi:hypothetical protein